MSGRRLDEAQELDEIIAAFVFSEEAGEPVSRQELINRHPEFAAELQQFFDDRDQFKRLASPLSPEAARRNDLPATVKYFGDYELLEEIAQGGMGVVYKARQTSLNRIVAVKMVLAGHLASDADIHRFTVEASTAAKLHHPGIVPIHEVGQQGGQHYFSMDLIDGSNLAHMICTDPPTPIAAARIVKEISDAVAYAHSQGTIHRDIKPSNILVDTNGKALITDFGLALRVEGDHELTRTGQILGTPSYMSPEQASGKRGEIGPQSDIYSIGAILYELLTGRPPFRGETSVATIQQVLAEEPVPPSRHNSAAPRDLETICVKCLQKEARERYATAELLSDDLGRFLADEPILARPVGALEKGWRWCRRNPTVACLTTAVVVVLLLGLASSTYFAIEAEQRARSERAARDLIEQREHELDAALRSLQQALADIKGLNSVLKVDPHDMRRLRTRGDLYGRLGMWEQACADYVAVVEQRPSDSWPYMHAAMLQFHIGDLAGHEQTRKLMLDSFYTTSDSLAANLTAMTGLRTPPSNSGQLNKASELAKAAIELSKGRPKGQMTWAQLANGAAEFRKGNFLKAIEWCEKGLEDAADGSLQTLEFQLVRAMSLWHLGQKNKAKSEFSFAKSIFEARSGEHHSGLIPESWKQRVEVEPMMQEAEQLIQSEQPQDLMLGDRLASQGRWQEALTSFNKAFARSGIASSEWNRRYAVLLLEDADIDGYLRLCEQALVRYGTVRNSADATQTAKTLLLDDSASDYFQEASRIAQLAHEMALSEQNYFVEGWALLALGLAALRQQDAPSSIELCEKCLAISAGGWTQKAQAHFVIAMARQLQEEDSLAVVAFDQGEEIVKENQPDFSKSVSHDWFNWLTCQILRRQAKSVLDSETEHGNTLDTGCSMGANDEIDSR